MDTTHTKMSLLMKICDIAKLKWGERAPEVAPRSYWFVYPAFTRWQVGRQRSDWREWFYLAAISGNVVMIDALLDSGVEVDLRIGGEAKLTPLMLAGMNGHTAAAIRLLEKGASVAAKDNKGTSVMDALDDALERLRRCIEKD